METGEIGGIDPSFSPVSLFWGIAIQITFFGAGNSDKMYIIAYWIGNSDILD
jgi:hypothetical protein